MRINKSVLPLSLLLFAASPAQATSNLATLHFDKFDLTFDKTIFGGCDYGPLACAQSVGSNNKSYSWRNGGILDVSTDMYQTSAPTPFQNRSVSVSEGGYFTITPYAGYQIDSIEYTMHLGSFNNPGIGLTTFNNPSSPSANSAFAQWSIQSDGYYMGTPKNSVEYTSEFSQSGTVTSYTNNYAAYPIEQNVTTKEQYHLTNNNFSGTAGKELFGYATYNAKTTLLTNWLDNNGIGATSVGWAGKTELPINLNVDLQTLGTAIAELWVDSLVMKINTSSISSLATGTINGGAQALGGVNYSFRGLHTDGELSVDYQLADAVNLQALVDAGQIGTPSFAIPGSQLQLFNVDYTGQFQGALDLTFTYDPNLIGDIDLATLSVFHWNDATSVWENLGGIVNRNNHTIRVSTTSLSPFALATVSEVPVPGAVWLFGSAILGFAGIKRSKS